jgi:hypothetical protein
MRVVSAVIDKKAPAEKIFSGAVYTRADNKQGK